MDFNPFSIYGITEYGDYKKVPLLKTDGVKSIGRTIKGDIRDGFRFPERLMILGTRGIGKTTTLFYLKELLPKKVNCLFTSHLVSDTTELLERTLQKQISLNKIVKDPTFIFVDFPDSIDKRKLRKFLEYVSQLMRHKNKDNINFVFAMNISHFNQAESISEVLGKFHSKRLEPLTLNETKKIIKSRLKLANGKEKVFSSKSCELIYNVSKGIPRNIIVACRDLTDYYLREENMSYKISKRILKEKYAVQIINDRIENYNKREIFKGFIDVIDNHFKGKVKSQKSLIKEVRKKLNIGRNKSMNIIDRLSKFGLLSISFSGPRNRTKIIEKVY